MTDVDRTSTLASVDIGGTKQYGRPGLWWLSPAVIPLLIVLAAVVPTAFTSDAQFRTSWRTPKSVTNETLVMFGCGAAALSFGALVGIALARRGMPRPSAAKWPSLDARTVSLLHRASFVLTVATVAGYVGFVLLIARAGISPAELFGGSDVGDALPLKDRIGTVPGVTTFTQLGIAAVVVSTTALTQRFTWREFGKIVLVVGLAVPRAYVYSERLALLELVIPISAIVAMKLSTSRGFPRVIAQTIPVFGMVTVVALFGVFEYFRSWTFYRSHGATSFWDFALNRFAGYYATALNNGQLVLDHLRWPNRWPYDTIEGFWSAPGVETVGLYERLSGHVPPYNRTDASPYFDVLRHYGNPEFNNPSGYAAPFADYGLIGGLAFFLIVGIILGMLYELFAVGRPMALLIYPVAFTGIVEMPRYLYWVQGRTTYTWLALLAITVLIAKITRRCRGQGVALTGQ